MKRPVRVDYELYEDFLQKKQNDLTKELLRYRSVIFDSTVLTGRTEYRDKYERKARIVDSEIQSMIKSVDKSSAFTAHFDFYFNDPRRSKKAELERDISGKIEQIAGIIFDRNDSECFSSYVRNFLWEGFFNDDNNTRQNKAHFLQITQGEPDFIRTLIKNNLLRTELFYMQRISERAWRTYHGGCYFGGPLYSIVSFPSKPFFSGEKISANIYFATDESQNHNSYSAKTGKITTENYCEGNWSDIANSVGTHTAMGQLIQHLHDGPISVPWSFQYFVLAKGACLLLDKTNTCYRDMENPVTIIVPGYSSAELSLRVSGAKVVKVSDGHYQIIPAKNSTNEIVAYVDAKGSEGIINTMSITRIKVKDVPSPYTGISNSHIEAMDVGWFKSQKGITIIPFDPDFAMNYTVTSFEMDIIKQSSQHLETYDIHGPDFANNEAAADAIGKLSSGDKVYISNVRATTKAGEVVSPAPLAVLLK